jgi:hypothetical protein
MQRDIKLILVTAGVTALFSYLLVFQTHLLTRGDQIDSERRSESRQEHSDRLAKLAELRILIDSMRGSLDRQDTNAFITESRQFRNALETKRYDEALAITPFPRDSDSDFARLFEVVKRNDDWFLRACGGDVRIIDFDMRTGCSMDPQEYLKPSLDAFSASLTDRESKFKGEPSSIAP